MTVELHIDPTGQDDNPGSRTLPLATLRGARERLRGAKRDGVLPPDGAVVVLHAGIYRLDEPFVLNEEDSGTAHGPIVYHAGAGETVRLIGGRRLEAITFTRVTDPAILSRLPPAASEQVVQADLRAQGVTDFGRFASRGFNRETSPAHLELFFNDRPMTVAQWPNAGQFATITGYTKSKTDDEWGLDTGDITGGFMYEGDRPRYWAPSDDIWVHGYWAYDWANSYEHVRRLDSVAGVVETHEPFGNISFRKQQRFYFLNVLEELDQPGEYYVDRTTGILYFWPPEPLAGAETVISELTEPLVSLQDVSYVEFRGLTLEAGRGCGIQATGGNGLLIAGCVLRNLGTWAVAITGGTQHVVAGCDIYGTGDGGVSFNGGDRKTLIPCQHAAINNHIHHYARWSRCYVAGINASGVGMRLANNLIHDAPHNAILFAGNEFLIENNEIYRVCLETGDAGAIYTGRDYSFRGNTIRRNFIHHMGGVGMGSMAIYMDDCVSGTHIAENILQECMYGIMLGGGRDFLVENNIFVNCWPAVAPDARGIDPNPVWQNMVNETMRTRLEAMRYHEPPYSERYPEIAGIDRHYAAGKGVPPENNRVERNICCGGTWIKSNAPANVTTVALKDNLVSADPGFTDPDFGVFSLCSDSPAWALGFKPIRLDGIGLIRDRYRAQLPPRVRAALRLLTPALVAGQPGRVRLLLRNDEDTVARGTAVAEYAGVAGVARVEFVLQPGEICAHEFTVIATAGAQAVLVSSPDNWLHPAKLNMYLAEGDASISSSWKVFAPLTRESPPPSRDELLRVPERLIVDGSEIAAVVVNAKNGKLDLAPLLGGTAVGRTAWAYIPFKVKTGGKTTLGFGADWWLQAWVDAEPVCDTMATGNGSLPPSAADHVVTIDLAPGEHRIVVRFVSGSMGSLLAVGGPEDIRRQWEAR
ncbi:MAG: right-handed parallel beta-helix repeat-containing protein [Phycisphaerae bacterium]|nr:right-handed parallel beta-helix repeat-containing protein [Phycisphaerae bacterium]